MTDHAATTELKQAHITGLPRLVQVVWITLVACLVMACTPVVMPAGPAVGAPSLREDAILTRDAAILPLRRFPGMSEPRLVLLALHGFNDHAGNFLIDSLPQFGAAGVLIYAYDQRGFGRAPGRGFWAGAETLATDAVDAARLVRQRHPDLPLFILGESMGAAVTVLAGASATPPPVDGYILLAPALWSREAMNPIMRGGLWLAARTIPMMGLQGGVSGIVASDNMEALRRLSRDPLTIRTTRVDAAVGLVDLMDLAVQALPHCCRNALGARMPALMLVGAQDMIVPARATRHAISAVPKPERPRLGIYQQGFHLLLAGSNREMVVRDILAFMSAPSGPLPSGADGLAAAWLDGEFRPGS
jgi:alpha-beta hydrolase superfamily lysophospholipase